MNVVKQYPLSAYFLLLILAVLFGGQFSLVKIAIGEFTPIHLSFFRLLFSSCAITLFVLLFHETNWNKNIRAWKICLTLGLLGEIIAPTLIAYASPHIASGLSGIVIATAPFFTIMLGFFFLKNDPINKYQLMGIAIGFLGILLIFWQNLNADFSFSLLLPLLLLVGAACALGGANVVGKKLENTDPIIATLLALSFSTVLFSPSLIIEPFSSSYMSQWSFKGTASIIMLSIGVNVLGTILFIHLAKKYGAIFVSYVGYLIPLIAYIIGVTFMDESVNLIHGLGIIIILLGLLLLKRSQ